MEVRALARDERRAWLRLRQHLWPDSPPEKHRREQDEILDSPDQSSVFVAATPGGELVGFVEVSLRDRAEGCESRPVGYVEGWFVEPGLRRAGVGRKLIEAAETWAAGRGCTEMGSDALLDNEVSHRAHGAVGYSEVERLVHFRKTLAPGRG